MSDQTSQSNITIVEDMYAWENKYRPDNLDEIIIPSDVRNRLHKTILDGKGQIPSFLFYSPQPGTGKTTSALALCNEIGCKKPLFINASKDNSIDVIREKVMQYATGVSVLGGRKVVILDEVERLSDAAQESLKGVIEYVASNCSFVLTTNAKMRVNAALRSRCREYDFIWNKEESKEVQKTLLKRMVEILNLEGVEFSGPALGGIVQHFFPDVRKMMGLLQENATTYGRIDERALSQIKSRDVTGLVDLMVENNWAGVKQWLFDNQTSLTEDFYSVLFKACVPMDAEKPRRIKDESIPDFAMIVGEEQKYHRAVGDLWLHFLQMCTNIMFTVKWVK